MRSAFLAFTLLFAGLCVMALGWLFYASNAMPYQDATPELLAHQAAEAQRWSLVMLAGLLMTVTGGMLRWRARRNQRKTQGTGRL